jgi:uncharacterized protein
MQVSEDRISNLAHRILDDLWKGDLVDVADESRALLVVKEALTGFFSIAEEVDEAVRKKLRGKMPGSRDWDVLYHKFYLEEMARRKW